MGEKLPITIIGMGIGPCLGIAAIAVVLALLLVQWALA